VNAVLAAQAAVLVATVATFAMAARVMEQCAF
jgi:hypothetical protein